MYKEDLIQVFRTYGLELSKEQLCQHLKIAGPDLIDVMARDEINLLLRTTDGKFKLHPVIWNDVYREVGEHLIHDRFSQHYIATTKDGFKDPAILAQLHADQPKLLALNRAQKLVFNHNFRLTLWNMGIEFFPFEFNGRELDFLPNYMPAEEARRLATEAGQLGQWESRHFYLKVAEFSESNRNLVMTDAHFQRAEQAINLQYRTSINLQGAKIDVTSSRHVVVLGEGLQAMGAWAVKKIVLPVAVGISISSVLQAEERWFEKAMEEGTSWEAAGLASAAVVASGGSAALAFTGAIAAASVAPHLHRLIPESVRHVGNALIYGALKKVSDHVWDDRSMLTSRFARQPAAHAVSVPMRNSYATITERMPAPIMKECSQSSRGFLQQNTSMDALKSLGHRENQHTSRLFGKTVDRTQISISNSKPTIFSHAKLG